MFGLIFMTLFGCAHTQEKQPTPYPLTKEYYEWVCHDYEDVSEVEIETVTCDDDVLYIVSEVHLNNGQVWKRKLDRGEACLYSTFIPLHDEYCIEVEGVTLTAYAH